MFKNWWGGVKIDYTQLSRAACVALLVSAIATQNNVEPSTTLSAMLSNPTTLSQAFTSADLKEDDVVQFRSTVYESLSEEDMQKPVNEIFDRFKGELEVIDRRYNMAAGLGGLTKPSKSVQMVIA